MGPQPLKLGQDDPGISGVKDGMRVDNQDVDGSAPVILAALPIVLKRIITSRLRKSR
jgi:hypothetical protein